MRTLKQFIDSRPRKLAAISPEQSVLRALEIMAEYDVGALLVLDGRKLVGVFSERDYARKVILQGKASRNTKVSEVMTGRVYYASLDTSFEECMALMTEKRFRHLPILDTERNVVGIISIGDVVKELLTQQQFIIGQMEKYITGQPLPAEQNEKAEP